MKRIVKIMETRPQSSNNALKWIKICKIHDVEKSTLVFGFQKLFSVLSLSLAQKTFLKKLEKKLFQKCDFRILEKVLNLAINLIKKKCFFKANFTLVLHWCSVFDSLFGYIFELCTENMKKIGTKLF